MVTFSLSQAGHSDHLEQEEDRVGREAVPRRVRERGLEAGGRRHVVQEQPLPGKDRFQGESTTYIRTVARLGSC